MRKRDVLRAKMRETFGSRSPADDANGSVQVVRSLRKNEDTGRIVQMPVAFLVPNPDQPRKEFDEEALTNLTASVKEKGVLLPLLVREDKNDPRQERHIIIAGERRWRAAHAAGLSEVPALVRSGDDALEVAIIENLQRENLKPLEEAEALQRLKHERGYTDEMLAQVVGKSRSSITETLSLNQLPADIKGEMRGNVGHPTLTKSLLLEVVRAGGAENSPEAMAAAWEAVKTGEAPTVRDLRTRKQAQRGPGPKNFSRRFPHPDRHFAVTVSFRKQHVSGREIKAALQWAHDQLT
jgi:ParB family chromosome partitioning protein